MRTQIMSAGAQAAEGGRSGESAAFVPDVFAGSRFRSSELRELNIKERLLLAPSKDDNVAIENCYVVIVRQNFVDRAFQTNKGSRHGWQDFHTISDFET
jgi:hypothetical protein